MHERIAQRIEVARQRRSALVPVLVLTAAYWLLGGLGTYWSLAGIAAALCWAAYWPAATGDALEPGGYRSNTIGPAPEPSRPDNNVPTALPMSLLEGLPDAALALDAQGNVMAANAAAWSVSPAIAGRPVSHWNRSPELQAAVDQAIGTGTQRRCHVRLFTPVERSLDVLVTPSGRVGEEAAPVVLVTCRDLTEQESLTRMRADFVANASHELRSPLASLRGFIETLQGAAKDDPAARDRFLGIMQAQAERMSRLIEDLLSLSRIEMREHVAPTASVDLAAVVQDIASALKPQAEKAGVALSVKLDGSPCEVIGDRDELAQVAQNLLQNAIKYGRANGKVDVLVNRQGRNVVLEVTDDGIGIAPEHLPRLTERFYRVSAKISKDRGGTGLGLAIVKHIVNRHHGELRISSTPGKGSVFAVVLPRPSKIG